MISVPIYAQRDGKWGSLTLGSSGLSVASYGCTSVCCAACLGTDPATFIDKMNNNAGYTPGGLLIWQVAANLFNGSVSRQDWSENPSDLDWIKNFLQKGYPVIFETRFPGNYDDNERSKASHMHFVVCVADDFTINDPWFNDQVKFTDRYGDPARWIYSAVCFNKIVGSSQNQVTLDGDKFSELVDKSSRYDTFVAGGYKSIDDVNKKLSDLTSQIHEFSISLDTEKQRADNLDSFLGQLAQILNVPKEQSQVLSVINGMISSADSVEKLTKQISDLQNELANTNGAAENLTKQLRDSQILLQEAISARDQSEKQYKDLLAITAEPLIRRKFAKWIIEIFST